MAKKVVLAAAPLWDPLYVASYRRRRRMTGPIPPFANRRRVAAWRIPYYFEGGATCRDDLAGRIAEHSGRALDTLDVLDLACGPGRIAQHFDGQFRSLTASDVDPTAVAFLRRSYPRITAVVNGSEPPLPFADASFDVVYSWSLWTHLPVAHQDAYLAEVTRVLRPGGTALLTTNGHHFLDDYHAYPRVEPWWLGVSHADLSAQGCIFHEYEFLRTDTTDAFRGVSGSFGLTFHDPAFVRAHWPEAAGSGRASTGSSLEVLTVEEGTLSNHQDLVVLRRPGLGHPPG